jgi:hypothetical protein
MATHGIILCTNPPSHANESTDPFVLTKARGDHGLAMIDTITVGKFFFGPQDVMNWIERFGTLPPERLIQGGHLSILSFVRGEVDSAHALHLLTGQQSITVDRQRFAELIGVSAIGLVAGLHFGLDRARISPESRNAGQKIVPQPWFVIPKVGNLRDHIDIEDCKGRRGIPQALVRVADVEAFYTSSLHSDTCFGRDELF